MTAIKSNRKEQEMLREKVSKDSIDINVTDAYLVNQNERKRF